jgi:deazaflavin-dependent oxidoreductase (nitroreductase family)
VVRCEDSVLAQDRKVRPHGEIHTKPTRLGTGTGRAVREQRRHQGHHPARHLPVIIVTHTGNKTGAVRKTPLMRVKDGNSYVLVGSQGGAPKDPVWVHNLRASPKVELRDETVVRPMQVREVKDKAERERLWKLAVAAYPPYAEYQVKTTRQIPVFLATP